MGGMRRYRLTELEVVTGLVGGLAVPVERRRGMMKDDGLKVRLFLYFAHIPCADHPVLIPHAWPLLFHSTLVSLLAGPI